MSDEQGYNGWSNYETWAMALWIDNDRGSYNDARELATGAREAHKARTGYGCEVDGSLAHALQMWQQEALWSWEDVENRPASVFSDLLGAAFSEIDWFEIARAILSETVDA